MTDHLPAHAPGRGRWAIRSLIATAVASLVAQVLKPVFDDALRDPTHLTPGNRLGLLAATLVYLVYFVGFISSALTFIVWEYRTIKTMTALDLETADLAPADAAIWWFVPVVNLWKPYAVLRALSATLAPRVTRLAALWWTAYLMMSGFGLLSQSQGPIARLAGWLMAAAAATSAALLVHVVRNVQEGLDRAVLRRRALMRERAARLSMTRAQGRG